MKLWLTEAPTLFMSLGKRGGHTIYEPRDLDGPGTDPATPAAGPDVLTLALAGNMQGYRAGKMLKN